MNRVAGFEVSLCSRFLGRCFVYSYMMCVNLRCSAMIMLAVGLMSCAESYEPTAHDLHDQDATEGFTKPASSEDISGPRFAVEGELKVATENSRWSSTSFHARPHMRARRQARESWLFPGEYFVVDGLHYTSRYEGMVVPSVYHLLVLLNGRPVPHYYAEVTEPDGFLELELIEGLDEGDFIEVSSLESRESVPSNFTLVVPPWAFPDEGAFNLTVVYVPEWDDHEGRGAFREDFPIHRTMTVYYGSEDGLNRRAQIPSRQHELRPWDGYIRPHIMYVTDGMFLPPTTEIYDWKEADSLREELGGGMKMVETFDVSGQSEVTLSFYIVGGDFFTIDSRNENVYVVFQGSEVIDVFRLTPPTVSYSALDSGEGRGAVLPITVPLTEDAKAVQVLAIPQPFEVQDPLFESVPMLSTAVKLRSVPE